MFHEEDFLVASVLALGLSSFWFLNASGQGDAEVKESDLLTSSVEALASGEGTGNTGPREKAECKGGYHKMVCVCLNDSECTDSECF